MIFNKCFIYSLSVLFLCAFEYSGESAEYKFKPDTRNYTGKWIVISKSHGKPLVISHYKNGVKHGEEISWYVDFNNYRVQTKQNYKNGKLHGLSERYFDAPNSKPYAKGIFENGKPKNGVFLINSKGGIITLALLPHLFMRNINFVVAEYKSGTEIRRFHPKSTPVQQAPKQRTETRKQTETELPKLEKKTKTAAELKAEKDKTAKKPEPKNNN